MKRWIALLLAVVMVLALCACGSGTKRGGTDSNSSNSSIDSNDISDSGDSDGDSNGDIDSNNDSDDSDDSSGQDSDSGGGFSLLGGEEKTPEPENTAIRAMIDLDGTAYIPLMDGTALQIDGDVRGAMLSPDRTTVMVMEENGNLYYALSDDLENKTRIAGDVEYAMLTDSGVLYEVDEEMRLYSFETGESTLVISEADYPDMEGFLPSENGQLFMMADGLGSLRLITGGIEGAERLASYSGEYPDLLYLADDGTEAVWQSTEEHYNYDTDETTYSHTGYRYVNGEREKIAEVDGWGGYSSVLQHSKDGSFFVLADMYADALYFWNAGGETVTARLGNTLAQTSVYTRSGLLTKDGSDAADGLYVLVSTGGENYNANNLYFVTLDGDRERVLSDVASFQIINGRIYYKTSDDSLYFAGLNGDQIGEAVKIAKDCYYHQISMDGRYVYYTREPDGNDLASLYRYNVQTDENERVSSEAYGFYFFVSNDGESVFYFEDVQDYWLGTLMRSELGQEPERIATDVTISELNSGLEDGFLAESFMFCKYMGTDIDSDGYYNDLYNWVYYNGEETVTLAREVCYGYGYVSYLTPGVFY